MTGFDSSKLELIFQIVLDPPEGMPLSSLSQITYRRWDSLATVSIIAAMESEYGINLDSAERERVTSFSAAKILLEEKFG